MANPLKNPHKCLRRIRELTPIERGAMLKDAKEQEGDHADLDDMPVWKATLMNVEGRGMTPQEALADLRHTLACYDEMDDEMLMSWLEGGYPLSSG